MNWKTMKGQILILASGLFFAIGILLVLSNARNEGELWWFAKNTKANMSLVMLVSVLVGVGAIFMFKVLLRGIRDLKIGRLQSSLQRVNKIDKAQEKSEPRES